MWNYCSTRLFFCGLLLGKYITPVCDETTVIIHELKIYTKLFLPCIALPELLHYVSDAAGWIQETLQLCHFSRFPGAGEGGCRLWLWWRRLSHPIYGLRHSGEDAACKDEGKEAICHQLNCLCECLFCQQAFQQRLLINVHLTCILCVQ